MYRRGLSLVALIACGLVLWSPRAYAYLDPGTGSMLLQLLLGGVAGAAVLARAYWSQLKNLFRHKTSAEENRTDDERG